MIAANILQPLIDAAEKLLVFFHDNLGFGWGISIIALTFVTRLLILPLSIKQLRSVRVMQVHAPQIKEIQTKYKADRQRMQQELMRFYQENNVNPFASCIPLILQFPVFITLFYVLRHDLKPHLAETHAHGGNIGFWFIPNLGEPATGGVLITLLVLYFLTMLGSTLVMQTSADRSQRIMMFALPVIFTPIIISFPAGLVLYWITTNVWTIGQQYAVRELMPAPAVPTPEEARAAKPPPPPPRKRKQRR
jgi:YidC/Oxa1 family membrane protein insertase